MRADIASASGEEPGLLAAVRGGGLGCGACRHEVSLSLGVEPPPGFEPGTYALRERRSTPELRRQDVGAKSYSTFRINFI